MARDGMDLLAQIVQVNVDSLASINGQIDASRRQDSSDMAKAFLRLLVAVEKCPMKDRYLWEAEADAACSVDFALRLIEEAKQ